MALALALAGALRAAPVRFDLPVQPAASALVAFAKQAGVEVLFSFDELKRVEANAVVGVFEPDAALAQLLRGTGFSAARNRAGKFVITRERRAALGEIRGSVIGPEGQPIAGAAVRLAESNAGVRTRDDGTFLLREIPAKEHALIVQAERFATLHIADVRVVGGERTQLGPARLNAGPDTEKLNPLVVSAEGLGAASAPIMLQLAAMIVTPSRYGLEDDHGRVAATLTESDLLALPQLGEDLYRAISHLPGLAVDDLSARFWVRGAPHEQVLARLDGIDLIEPFHLKDTDSSLSILDLETISRLELFTGGFAAEFGDRAAGVLLMETDSHQRAKSRTTLGLSLTGARAASRGRTPGGTGRWLVSLRSGYPDIAIEAQNDGDSELRPRYYDAMAKWEQTLSPQHTLALHALHAGDRMFFRDADGPQLTSRYGSDYFWARWRAEFARASAETVLSHTHILWRRNGTGSVDRTFPLEVHDSRSLRQTALRQDWNFTGSERLIWRGGFDAKHGRVSYDYRNLSEFLAVRNNAFTRERLTRAVRVEGNGNTLGAFGALRWQSAESLVLEPGLRFDRNDYAHDRDVSPRLNVAWQSGRRTTWRAAWGLYHQAQGLHTLSVQDGDTTFRRSERAEHRVLSVEQRLPAALNLRVEAYERIVRRPRPHWENVVDALDAIAEVESDRLRLDPVRMRARGVELIAEQRGGGRFGWSASYAYARAEETLASGLTLPRKRDQRHTLYMDATYSPSPRWQFSVAWQYHTGWPATSLRFSRVPLTSGGTAIVSNIGTPYDLSLPAYQRLDLRAQRRFLFKHGVLRAYLDVFNALDRRNIIDYSYRVNFGATGQLVTERSNGDSLFPRLPSVGLTWDF